MELDRDSLDSEVAEAPASGDAGDLTALAWVHDEVCRSLDNAHKSLRRLARDLEVRGGQPGLSAGGITPAVQQARTLIHQSVGVLDMVGLLPAARCLAASELVLQRLGSAAQAFTPEVIAAIERVSFSVQDFLGKTLASQPVAPLSLFPAYRDALRIAGAERIHPADLQALTLPEASDVPRPAVTPHVIDDRLRTALESVLLDALRGKHEAQARMCRLYASLAAGAEGEAGMLWTLAAAFYEAQAVGLLLPDDYSRPMGARLLAQVRAVQRGSQEVPQRLLQDLWFFCARAGAPRRPRQAPLLLCLRESLPLPDLAKVSYQESALGRFDPALVPQARRRVGAFKDIWAVAASGDAGVLPACAEQVSLVADSVSQLYPQGPRLATALQAAVRGCVGAGRAPTPELAMEVATTLLCLDAALDDLDQVDLPARVDRLSERLEGLAQGRAPEPVEPWMETLYREVSDRQTMGSVVQELRAALAEVEQQLDRFHRHPQERELLIPVPAQLATMRGVLSVLGLSAAAQAVLRMRSDVEDLTVGAEEADEAQARLADNLGVMSFLIDMLGVQPALAKSLFRFDAESGRFSAVMGRALRSQAPTADDARLLERAQALAGAAADEAVSHDDISLELDRLAAHAQAADQAGLAEAAARAKQALHEAEDDQAMATARAEVAQVISAVTEPTVPAPLPLASAPGAADDDEDMREIFFEEAAEVIAGARDALHALEHDAHDLGAMTTVRRAFHTLKGSARMVQLRDFGEVAWSCEQLYNVRLALAEAQVDRELRAFTSRALDQFQAWVDALVAGRAPDVDGPALSAQALALREATVTAPAPQLAPSPFPPIEGFISTEGESVHATRAPAGDEVLGEAQALPDVSDTPIAADEAPDLPEVGSTQPLPLKSLSDLDLPALDLLDLEQPDFVPSTVEVPALTAGAGFTSWADLLDPDAPAPAPVVATPPTAPAPELDFSLDLDLDGVPDTGVAPGPVAADGSAAESTDWSPTSFEAAPDLSAGVDFELDLDTVVEGAAETLDPLPPAPLPDAEPEQRAPADNVVALPLAPSLPLDEAERYKIVGDLRVPIALFNIYLNEADEQSRRLCTELAEWQMELDQPVGESAIALAHSMAGNSATVGFSTLSQLARRLEHTLERSRARGQGEAAEASLFADVAEEIRRLLHQFAAGFLRELSPELDERLAAQEAHDAAQVSLHGVLHDEDAVDEAPTPGLAAPWVDEPVVDEPMVADHVVAEAVVDEPVRERVVLGEPAFTPLRPAQDVTPAAVSVRASEVLAPDDDLDAVDAIDAELFEIFVEEAQELLPALAQQVRAWEHEPGELGHGVAAMRSLHTLKGGARLAGAMRLGEMAHRMESSVESMTARNQADLTLIAPLHAGVDALAEELRRLLNPGAEPAQSTELAAAATAPAAESAAATSPSSDTPAAEPAPIATPPAAPPLDVLPAAPALPVYGADQPQIDWARYALTQPAAAPALQLGGTHEATASGMVRVRAALLDRLVGHAGEVGTARGRIDSEVGQMRGHMRELSDNLERLRRQLRDLEIQAETQMSTRLEAARQSQQAFDPLEMDRFTRVQELTRMMAESVGDVGTVQRSLQQALQTSEDQLAAQARLTRDLQDDLLRARMVEFDTVSDRLYRVVRQAAKESGKQVRLNFSGATVELDRSVLERMAPAFEHLLRNAVVHGIEATSLREVTGKDAVGSIDIGVRQLGNEVRIEVRDDGAGLNLVRIAERARASGLLGADDRPTEAELANLIFRPGFSTAEQVTELAGRGIGMDVVRQEVTAMGGRIETSTAAGQGTAFQLVLPLTTAVSQVVLLRCDELVTAVPSTLVEQVRRVPVAEIESAYTRGVLRHGDRDLPFFWLGALLQQGLKGAVEGKTAQVLIVRSASQHVAVHVGEVLGNQEVVVKNLGPQLARMPGLAGMSLRTSGEPVLIYNPVALAAVYGEALQQQLARQGTPVALPQRATEEAPPQAPLVLVVDDSLTVRRVTQRLLQREGFRVALARDGLEALEQLAVERPVLMLSDIEMPRMDGFDLVRNVKAEPRWQDLPIVMITSRIAQKHRDHATELGVQHYLGKPYDEDTLLNLVRQYAGQSSSVTA